MSEKRHRKAVAGVLLVYLVYLVVSGGGILVEHRDSLAELGVVAEARLTPHASVYLKETPHHVTIMVPLLLYYERYTYPFTLRFYGSTKSRRVVVTDERRAARAGSPGERVVVTEVAYYRQPERGDRGPGTDAVNVTSWADIVIPGPGTWIVESKGYLEGAEGTRSELTFPPMTIRQTVQGRIRVHRAVTYWLGKLP